MRGTMSFLKRIWAGLKARPQFSIPGIGLLLLSAWEWAQEAQFGADVATWLHSQKWFQSFLVSPYLTLLLGLAGLYLLWRTGGKVGIAEQRLIDTLANERIAVKATSRLILDRYVAAKEIRELEKGAEGLEQRLESWASGLDKWLAGPSFQFDREGPQRSADNVFINWQLQIGFQQITPPHFIPNAQLIGMNVSQAESVNGMRPLSIYDPALNVGFIESIHAVIRERRAYIAALKNYARVQREKLEERDGEINRLLIS